MQTISIGNQSFSSIREKSCFYIDKTDFIREWWESDDVVTLITRPRRFGKTLNMSMLECFFSYDYAGRSELFEGLSIWQEEKYQALQGTYPVIFLSFAAVKADTYENTRMQIVQSVIELYNSFDYLLKSGSLNESEKNYFVQIQNGFEMNNGILSGTIHSLSSFLYKHHKKKVLILLDEYDTPMQEAYVGGYWNEMTALIRSMFNATFKTNSFLERALMTGITRVSKESIFSDLNNLKVITTTVKKYETSFGFTEEEVFEALDTFALSDKKADVKHWYDGFIFGTKSDIYNPWSITNFLDERKLDIYWANTSSNGLIGTLIQQGSTEVKKIMEDFLIGRTFTTQIDEQIVFNQLEEEETAIWSLMLASGYLKVLHSQFPSDGEPSYELGITNREVLSMFKRMIKQWFRKPSARYNDFVKALLLGDLDAMNEYMNKVALQTFSSFDIAKNASAEDDPERFYHGFVLGLMVELSDKYSVVSNRESGFGRYDVMLKPKDKKGDAIIIEFKVHRPKREATLEETVQAALGQIREKRYHEELIAEGYEGKKIRCYGFGFKGKEVLIG